MKKVLAGKFFNRKTLTVAQGLLGKFIVVRRGKKSYAYMITEVEAYDGHLDKASHAHRGETARNMVMFGKSGVWYVYFVYGMYNMLNIVTGREKFPAAVLIRGVEKASGPGRLTKKLHITRKYNGKIARKKTGLWIEDRGIRIRKKDILRTPRIGVHYAGSIWSKKPYRFVIKKYHDN